MKIIDCGVIDFHQALLLQEKLVTGIASGHAEETLLLLEHPPVYTIGRGGDRANILDDKIAAERINRGGDVTWHGPGQVVGYPLVNLDRRGRDLHRWLRFLEELLAETLHAFGINGRSFPGCTGVWTGHGKIAFIGVGVRRWVTMHGFSLNVHPDLRAYDRINPCGLAGCPVTSMALEKQESPTQAEVSQYLQKVFDGFLNERLPYRHAPGKHPQAVASSP